VVYTLVYQMQWLALSKRTLLPNPQWGFFVSEPKLMPIIKFDFCEHATDKLTTSANVSGSLLGSARTTSTTVIDTFNRPMNNTVPQSAFTSVPFVEWLFA